MNVQQTKKVPPTSGDGVHSGIVAGRRYRLSLTSEQEHQAVRVAGCCRALWNAALDQRQLAYELQAGTVWASQQMAELPGLKRSPGFEWLAEDGIAQCLQQTLRDLDVAYQRFFAGVGRFPVFKRKGCTESFRLPQGRDLAVRRLNRRWAHVRVPKLGWCRFRLTRPIDGQIRNATISRDGLGWHVSFCVHLKQEPLPANGGSAVGVDYGVAATAALSTGALHHSPDLSTGQLERLRRLERQAGRQETARRRRPNKQRKRSRRHQQTLDQVAQLRARRARIRKDFAHKLTTQLAKTHGLVAVESLKIQNMTRTAKGTTGQPGVNVAQKAGLNRAILAQGWGQLRQQLAYKTVWYGSSLVQVPAHHTSQTCQECGHVAAESRKSQAVFCCVACGNTTNADVNAAKVILDRALTSTPFAEGLSVTARGGFAVRQPVKREPLAEGVAA